MTTRHSHSSRPWIAAALGVLLVLPGQAFAQAPSSTEQPDDVLDRPVRGQAAVAALDDQRALLAQRNDMRRSGARAAAQHGSHDVTRPVRAAARQGSDSHRRRVPRCPAAGPLPQRPDLPAPQPTGSQSGDLSRHRRWPGVGHCLERQLRRVDQRATSVRSGQQPGFAVAVGDRHHPVVLRNALIDALDALTPLTRVPYCGQPRQPLGRVYGDRRVCLTAPCR